MDTVSVSDVWTCSGKLFHAAGPATERARFPTCSRVRGTSNSPRAEDHREAQDSTLERKKKQASERGSLVSVDEEPYRQANIL